jgi:hypothetical protein
MEMSDVEGDMRLLRNLLTALILPASGTVAHSAPQWLTLPPTPTLPKPAQSGFAQVNGIRLTHAPQHCIFYSINSPARGQQRLRNGNYF